LVFRGLLIVVAQAGLIAIPASAGAGSGHHAPPVSALGRAAVATGSAVKGPRCNRRHLLGTRPCKHRRHQHAGGSEDVPAVSPSRIASEPAAKEGRGQRATAPPKFAGIQWAFACTPGPQTPGETTPFNLGWEAATDDVTPPGLIVYDIYMAPQPGGEDFSSPTWTTEPGATEYRTEGLPSHGTFYFVVRARDRAGNEDANTVEVRGSDPCV
jgi:hypothetical protein